MSTHELVRRHLSGRAPLGAVEQARLDRDGDAVLTAVDLLLWAREAPGAGPRLLPPPFATVADPTLRPGEIAKVAIRGEPRPVRALLEHGSRSPAKVERTKDGASVTLPPLAGRASGPVGAALWLVFDECLPARLWLQLCPGPVIEAARLEGEELLLRVRGLPESAGWQLRANGAEHESRRAAAGELGVRIDVARVVAFELEVDGVRSNVFAWAGDGRVVTERA